MNDGKVKQGFARRKSWPILRHCSGIYLEKLMKTTKIYNPAKMVMLPEYKL
jgi:hypothetical protein